MGQNFLTLKDPNKERGHEGNKKQGPYKSEDRNTSVHKIGINTHIEV